MSTDKRIIIGVDEVGCGAIAGPVVVAAVAAYEDWTLPGLRDSKKLSAKKREELVPTIAYQAIAQHIYFISEAEVDTLGFQESLMAAMRSAIMCVDYELKQGSDVSIIIDGSSNPFHSVELSPNLNNVGKFYLAYRNRIRVEPKADDKYPTVSAASVIAKVNRDVIMTKLGYDFPSYNFAQHKGYPTKEHKELLEKLGPCIHHRRSSAPVRAVLEKRNEKRTVV